MEIALGIFIRGSKTCVVTSSVFLTIQDGCIFSEKLADCPVVSVSLNIDWSIYRFLTIIY